MSETGYHAMQLSMDSKGLVTGQDHVNRHRITHVGGHFQVQTSVNSLVGSIMISFGVADRGVADDGHCSWWPRM